ncbi:DNA ligase [Frankliniella fusca]|uniref:DNA ligase n=1 Tax=Frankliniella fusca TaxID=407009 RepID=A0AAE1LES3_9NEOP|nr:DNA ligase [Frankliniella fusca]
MASTAHGQAIARAAHGQAMAGAAHGQDMARRGHGQVMARIAHGQAMAMACLCHGLVYHRNVKCEVRGHLYVIVAAVADICYEAGTKLAWNSYEASELKV